MAIWLRDLGLERYAQAFRDNEIDAAILPTLTAQDLSDLGVSIVGHRRKLLNAIAALSAAPAPSAPELEIAPLRSEAERRQLTVMFADLVDSTVLSARLDPEDLRDLIRAYQDAATRVIGQYEGYVAKFMGDGVLAYFGYPTAHEDDAERAVRSALALVDAITALKSRVGETLRARIGIATGLVVAGDLIGEATDRDAVVGETPNLAARLQGVAEPDTVVIAAGTRQLLGDLFELIDCGRHRLKGFVEPVQAWRVAGQSRATGRFEAFHGATLTPLAGRTQEVALLLDRWAQAREGDGQVVLLAGEPGIGKSRIVQALHERAGDDPHVRIRYFCSPYHINSAFHPIIERLARAAGFAKDDSPEAKLDKLEALLAPSTVRMAETAPLLAALLSIPTDDRYPPSSLSRQLQKQRTLEVMAGQIEALAERQPVMMICEDAHWIDPSTQELITLLVQRLGRLAVLLLVTYRPAFTPPWTGHPHVTQLSLNRLSRRRSTEIIDRLAGGKSLPVEVAEQIVRKADGVPMFIEELTKTVLESGLLAEVGSHYELKGPLPSLAIPATLQDSLMARLDRLAPVKEVAQVASVIGREFSQELLVAAADRPEAEIDEALRQLASAELIFRRGAPPSPIYVFKHALVQETAYRSLLRGRRQLLHSRIAEFLRQRSPDTAQSQPELLAHHFSEAGFAERAADYWLEAGRRAKERYANQEAKAHLRLCLETADAAGGDAADLASTKAQAWVLLGDLASLAEDLDQANAAYRRALNLAPDESTRIAIGNKLHRPSVAMRDGARIAFYEHGSGEHTLFFVNPIVYGLAPFQPILEQMCQEFRIITVDCRGTGASDPLTRPFSLREHVEDVAAVIASVGCGAVTGVGISRGSNLLIMLAASRPELVSRLVLVGCPLAPAGSGGFSSEYWRRRDEAYARCDVEALVRLQGEFVYSEPGTEELRRLVFEHRLKLPPDTILSFYDPDPAANVAPLLQGLAIPTLVTHGTDDQLISFATAEHLANEIAGAQLYPFEGKGHLPLFTATEEFCTVLRCFVLSGQAPQPS